MMTNHQRARDAEFCLATYSVLTGDEGRHAVIGLIWALGHSCDEAGTDFIQQAANGIAAWKAAKENPNDEFPNEPEVTITIHDNESCSQ